MNLGIVGHASDKFTLETKRLACRAIRDAIARHGATTIVSGHCHLGGVDIWAEKIAEKLGLPTIIHEPKVLQWSAAGGYKDRNLAIARDSDLVLVIVVQDYPPGYSGMTFPGCYHCKARNPKHVKSGGCWTAWQAAAREWAIL